MWRAEIEIVHILATALGLGTVLAAGLSALRTVVVPRGDTTRVARLVFAFYRVLFHYLAHPRLAWEVRDRRMTLFAPLALVTLPFTWAMGAMVGFSLVYWGLGDYTPLQAVTLSGSTLGTLGSYAPNRSDLLGFTIVEALLGVALVGLLISFLPTLYAAFSDREQAVTLLRPLAGRPPSGLELLVRFHRIGAPDRVDAYFEHYVSWFARVEESHTSFQPLVYFRSQAPDLSWVTTAGTMLDAAALANSALAAPYLSSGHCLWSGVDAVGAVARASRVQVDAADAVGEDAVPRLVSRDEFEAALDQLEAAGAELLPDRELCWERFAARRLSYEPALAALADLVMAPSALWWPGQQGVVVTVADDARRRPWWAGGATGMLWPTRLMRPQVRSAPLAATPGSADPLPVDPEGLDPVGDAPGVAEPMPPAPGVLDEPPVQAARSDAEPADAGEDAAPAASEKPDPKGGAG